MCKTGITNADDLYGAKIPRLFPDNDITTFGIDNHAKVMAKIRRVSFCSHWSESKWSENYLATFFLDLFIAIEANVCIQTHLSSPGVFQS